MWVSPWKVWSSVSPSEIEWSFDVEANRHAYGDFALSVHKEGLAWRDFLNRQWGSGGSCCFHSRAWIPASRPPTIDELLACCPPAAEPPRQQTCSRRKLVFWHSCVRVALSFRQIVHVTSKSPCNQHSSCLCIFRRKCWEEGKGGWEIETPTTTEQKCPCTSTNKKRSETRKGNWNLSISKKQKERRNERNSETGKGRGTVRKMPRNRKRSARAAL